MQIYFGSGMVMERENVGKEEGVETMQGINRVLPENLLPAHVARHFLTLQKVSHFNLNINFPDKL